MILERERIEHVEVLTLNRPDAANALNPELLTALSTAFEELAHDDEVRVLVLTGSGDRTFCAGMDLRAFSERRAEEPSGDEPRNAAGGPPFSLLREGYDKPVVAAVNGSAVGGGFELVLGCDLVVAADHARFGLPEVRRGLLPAGGGTLLGTRIPLNLALEVALTGRYVSAEEAAAWGLVNRVVPAGKLLETALELANEVAANGPLGVKVTKRLTRRAVAVDPQLGWGTPEELAEVFGSEDAKEGALAFIEKRTPHWQGR
ncbi:MAG TPA: enoyl-CoA hydratase-related protein [Acidimicrobiales bacterium]|nr:enoyl-CoA hydratase-related protein [Acidimicrobiales bacterium]